MNTKTIITITAATILLVAAFLFGKSCSQKCSEYSSAEIDSVVSVQKAQANSHQWYRDSVEGQIRLNGAAIAELNEQLTKTKNDAVKSKQSASYWSSLYRKSITAKDTPKAIIACDELQAEFESYLVKTDRYIANLDSITTVQGGTISLQSDLIEKQKIHIKSQDTAFQIVLAANNTLTQDNAKMEKRVRKAKRWGNVKTILAGVGGTFLGTQIKK
jgi:hypothetical protein